MLSKLLQRRVNQSSSVLKINLEINRTSSRKVGRSAISVFGLLVFLSLAVTTIPSARANNLPVIQKSGTLASNETWEGGKRIFINR